MLLALAAPAQQEATASPDATATSGATAPPTPVDQDPAFEALRARARELAQHEQAPRDAHDLPEWLGQLDYDHYRQLRFRPDAALWTPDELPFRVQLMHRGYLFKQRVRVTELVDGEEREVAFRSAQFAYPDDTPPVPDDLGYSGLSLSWRGPDAEKRDEVAAFQGASYFRLLGVGQVYGASARGLAIDTASPRGEEFPDFVELQLERPAPEAGHVVLHALLDSPRITGAYRFDIVPGERTTAAVTACLYPRADIDKLGLAPLTSMFLFGEDGLHRTPDWRPEVHDSDGLLVAGGDGSWTWRPLANPLRTHRITRLPASSPAGFGLLQRDRAFTSYEDLESHFERRPSLWITPRGDWGPGALELIEIPNEGEWNENVVASWVPEQPVRAGTELRFEYELAAQLEDPQRALGRATATRVQQRKESTLFLVDFEGGAAGDMPQADVVASRGTLQHVVVQPSEPAGSWRCSFELQDKESEPIDLRVSLRRGEQVVSETLLLTWVRS
ncbi:MAG TPA: glucan biosynthesis protein [Planctomycetota bacterium]|nr:glucan biosynthesis protein [Planctomycetota bacterium]